MEESVIKLTKKQVDTIENIITRERALQAAEIAHVGAMSEHFRDINKEKSKWWETVCKERPIPGGLMYDSTSKTVIRAQRP